VIKASEVEALWQLEVGSGRASGRVRLLSQRSTTNKEKCAGKSKIHEAAAYVCTDYVHLVWSLRLTTFRGSRRWFGSPHFHCHHIRARDCWAHQVRLAEGCRHHLLVILENVM
jgi:hypothetical protein